MVDEPADDAPDAGADGDADEEERLLSTRLEEWLQSDHRKTMGDLVDSFGPQSFALLFVILMAFPALPLPTGGLSHVLEIATMLLGLELVVGRKDVWIPRRLADRELKGITGPRFSAALLKRIRWFERFSRPRMSGLLHWRITGMAFGAIVFGLSLAAFFSPPFSGLDTLPSLGVVVLSLGVLFGDIVIAGAGLAIGAGGIGLVIGLGTAIVNLL